MSTKEHHHRQSIALVLEHLEVLMMKDASLRLVVRRLSTIASDLRTHALHAQLGEVVVVCVVFAATDALAQLTRTRRARDSRRQRIATRAERALIVRRRRRWPVADDCKKSRMC